MIDVSNVAQLYTAPPELPPRAASPNTAPGIEPPLNTSSSWYAQHSTASSLSTSSEIAQVAPQGRGPSHSIVEVSTSVTPPPNITVRALASQTQPTVDKVHDVLFL